jgi:hypothetical protein
VDLPAAAVAFGLQVHARRSRMILSARYPITSLYRVEVSGWDKNKAFFVEKSDLEWSEESGKRVALSRAVPDGAVVFLRLVPCLSTEQTHPVAYETEFVGTTAEGRHEFRLHPVSPHMVERNAAIN